MLHDVCDTEYFCVEKCVSLWPAAREAARQTATQQSPVPTHMATIHHCPPPTSTSLLPSILSFLIRSSHPRRLLSARSHSSRPATSTGALLIVVFKQTTSHREETVSARQSHTSWFSAPHAGSTPSTVTAPTRRVAATSVARHMPTSLLLTATESHYVSLRGDMKSEES